MRGRVNAAWAAWDKLWFSQVDARSLGALRVTLGGILIVWHTMYWANLQTLLAPWGAVDAAMLDSAWVATQFSYLAWVSEPWQLYAVHALELLVIVAFTVGYQTRLAKWLCVLILVSYWHRNPWFHNGGDRLLRISVITMALSPCGAALSLDALRGKGQRTAPVMAIRLLQLQWMIMYTYTGFAKVVGTTWQDGTALYYSLSNSNYARAPWLLDALLDYAPLRAFAMASTWVTLAWELTFIPLVLHPRTRTPALLLGLFFHVAVGASMEVGLFSLVSVWGYLAWVKPDTLGSWAQRWVPAQGPSLEG